MELFFLTQELNEMVKLAGGRENYNLRESLEELRQNKELDMTLEEYEWARNKILDAVQTTHKTPK